MASVPTDPITVMFLQQEWQNRQIMREAVRQRLIELRQIYKNGNLRFEYFNEYGTKYGTTSFNDFTRALGNQIRQLEERLDNLGG